MGSLQPFVPYGRRLIPIQIDEIARDDPKRLYGCIPRSTNLQDGFRDVTFADFARAINRAAAFIEEKLGRSKSFETIAYIGLSDLRYFIFLVGAAKVGYKLLLPSPRNSLEGQVNLFEKTACTKLFTSKGYPNSQDFIHQARISCIEVPELACLLADEEVSEYPWEKIWDEAKNAPFFVLHTSGSTGLPKPIVLTHGWTGTLDSQSALPLHNGNGSKFKLLENKILFSCMPPFHAAGVVMGLLAPLSMNSAIVFPPADRLPNAALIDEVLDSISIEVLYTPPSILEESVQDKSSLDKLSKLKHILYGGGPLERQAGDILSKRTNLCNSIGSTESGLSPVYFHNDPDDWEYFYFSPELAGFQFRDQGDGTYEQVIVRHPLTDRFHCTWWTFPDAQEYSMHDLYVKHPTKEWLWRYMGRADDVIVLSNGEKLNPTSMEDELAGHPDVKSALVVGQARFVSSAIIELRDERASQIKTPEQRTKFIENLWPYVIKANEGAPAHAQLSQDRIIISTKEKPFLRAGKGTVQRQLTIKAYAEEIDELYRRIEEEVLVDVSKIDVQQDLSSLEADIGKLVGEVIGVHNLGRDKDFFNAGMDSLHVMTVIKQFKSALEGVAPETIKSRLVYSNPSIEALAKALKSLCTSNGAINGTEPTPSQEQIIEETLANYISQLPPPASGTKPRAPNTPLTIILTGSTGSLGSYLLDTLLSNPQVSKIYCLNRRADATSKQSKENATRGLISEWDPQRIEFLHADLSKPLLGLSQETHEKLREETSVIIHNQWQVDFNLSLPSFHPHIRGTLNLIHLSASTPYKTPPPIYFTSSIGTLGNWPTSHPSLPVPETALTDHTIPSPQGYSQSKYIAELLLLSARERSGISSAILRVGQIAGPVLRGKKGVWNRDEWLPSLLSSSRFLGVLPGRLGGQEDTTWVPVDVLAGIVGELVVGCEQMGGEAWTRYYHLCNPKMARWEEIVPVVRDFYAKRGVELKIVAFGEWVHALERSAIDEIVDVEKNPGVKLLEFYQGLSRENGNLVLETKETEKSSESMRALKAVNGEWMEMWLEQWGFDSLQYCRS